MKMTTTGSSVSQLDKLKELARELETDDDEKHWDERLCKLARVKGSDDEKGK